MKHSNFKRFLSVLLTLFLTVALLPVDAFAATGTKDLDGHWASNAIQMCHSYGIMNGDGNGNYKPNADITRAEFAAMVNRAFGYDALSMPELSGYTDVPSGKWYAGDMQTAIALGIISGYGNGIAAPEDKITREQAAVILHRVLRLNITEVTATKFTDMGDVSSWATDAVLAMEQSGYIAGYNNQFMPKNNITRGETAQLLLNVFGVIVDGEWNTDGGTFQNMTIRQPGSHLTNAIINGDLFITEGVGDGDVYLDNVWITGRLLITGGGEHSIHVRNLTVGQNVVVDKPSVVGNEAVRFRGVQTNNTTVLFEGKAREVIITGDITVLIDADDEKTVFNMFAPSDPNVKPQLVISENAKIDKVVVAAPAEITGNGNVDKIEVRSENVEVAKEVKTDTVQAEKGIEFNIGGEVKTGEGITNPATIPVSETMPEPPAPALAPAPVPTPTPTLEPTPVPTPDLTPAPTTPPSTGNGGNGGNGGSTTTNAKVPSIITPPQSATVAVGTTHALTVSATVTDSGTLSYQWYSNTSASTSSGMAINGANGTSYLAPISTAGTFYYYVVVTNTNNNVNGIKTASVTSGVVTLIVTTGNNNFTLTSPSATYNASTGDLVINATELADGFTADVSKINVNGVALNTTDVTGGAFGSGTYTVKLKGTIKTSVEASSGFNSNGLKTGALALAASAFTKANGDTSNAVASADVTVSGIKSSDASLISVGGVTTFTWGGGNGSSAGVPKTVSITVANEVATITAANVIVATGATATLYGSNMIQTTIVNLTAGAETSIFIAVRAENNSTVYYKLDITRAAAVPLP